jgi:hypothetical protein
VRDEASGFGVLCGAVVIVSDSIVAALVEVYVPR